MSSKYEEYKMKLAEIEKKVMELSTNKKVWELKKEEVLKQLEQLNINIADINSIIEKLNKEIQNEFSKINFAELDSITDKINK